MTIYTLLQPLIYIIVLRANCQVKTLHNMCEKAKNVTFLVCFFAFPALYSHIFPGAACYSVKNQSHGNGEIHLPESVPDILKRVPSYEGTRSVYFIIIITWIAAAINIFCAVAATPDSIVGRPAAQRFPCCDGNNTIHA